MKLIQCIVHPAKLDQLLTALQPFTSGLTVHEIRSFGPGIGWHAIYRGVEYETLLQVTGGYRQRRNVGG